MTSRDSNSTPDVLKLSDLLPAEDCARTLALSAAMNRTMATLPTMLTSPKQCNLKTHSPDVIVDT